MHALPAPELTNTARELEKVDVGLEVCLTTLHTAGPAYTVQYGRRISHIGGLYWCTYIGDDLRVGALRPADFLFAAAGSIRCYSMYMQYLAHAVVTLLQLDKLRDDRGMILSLQHSGV